MKHARPDYDRIQDPSGRIPDDEPVFLLRGQDLAAPYALHAYADELMRLRADPELIQRVLKQADEMQRWQAERARKVPDL